jgi:hypothetical protein
MKKEIAVIGGGFAALNLVKQFAADGDFRVTLSFSSGTCRLRKVFPLLLAWMLQ